MDTLGEPELQGQVAVITGAGGGIGAAIAQRLARMGALTFLLRTQAGRPGKDGGGDPQGRGTGRSRRMRCDQPELG